MTTMYYDPVLDVHHRLPVSLALTTSYYSAPQRAEDSKRLFAAACESAGIATDPELPLRPSRSFAAALVLAKEWGMGDMVDRLEAAIDASYEPTWRDDTGEFTWGMGLDEPHPRGQFNAFLAAAEAAGPGMWTALSEAPLEPCPQIVGVDFPNLALSRAEWIDGGLYVGLRPLRDDPTKSTEFRIVGTEPRIWDLNGIEGAAMDVTANAVIVRVPMITADISFTPGSY